MPIILCTPQQGASSRASAHLVHALVVWNSIAFSDVDDTIRYGAEKCPNHSIFAFVASDVSITDRKQNHRLHPDSDASLTDGQVQRSHVWATIVLHTPLGDARHGIWSGQGQTVPPCNAEIRVQIGLSGQMIMNHSQYCNLQPILAVATRQPRLE